MRGYSSARRGTSPQIEVDALAQCYNQSQITGREKSCEAVLAIPSRRAQNDRDAAYSIRIGKKPGIIGFCAGSRPALFPWLSTEENVAYGLKLKANRDNGRDVRETVAAMLQLVQLDGFARHYPSDLSGGMRQRLEIARALAVDPEVLLMDEPLAALDALTRRTMQREVLHIWEKTRKTILFVTHDIDEAVVMADRIVVMAQRPTFVREIDEVRLPRPRLREDPEVGKVARRLSTLLE